MKWSIKYNKVKSELSYLDGKGVIVTFFGFFWFFFLPGICTNKYVLYVTKSHQSKVVGALRAPTNKLLIYCPFMKKIYGGHMGKYSGHLGISLEYGTHHSYVLVVHTLRV
jgi:hypothetical protein